MKGINNSVTTGSVLFVIFVSMLFISCSKPNECTSQINAGNKNFIGKGNSKERAIHNSCNKYCLEMDSRCDAIYRIWLDSPDGKQSGNISKMRAMYKNRRLLDCVTIICANECVKQLNLDEMKYTVKCE